STSGTVNGCSTARSVDAIKDWFAALPPPSAVPIPVQDASARPEDAQSQSLKTRGTPSSFGTFSGLECCATIPHRSPQEEIGARPLEGKQVREPASPSRRKVIGGAAAAAAILGAPAMVRSQQPKRFLRPLVAGLNAKEGDPSYESIARIPKILREKHNVLLEI